MQTKIQATKIANQTKKFLDKETGVKWKIRIHENLGWHTSSCYVCKIFNNYFLRGELNHKYDERIFERYADRTIYGR